MRKVCASVCLVAAVLAGGPAFAADTHAVLRSSHLIRSDGSGDCGPMHDDNAVPSTTTQNQDDSRPRAERGSMAGSYCDSDSGVPRRPGPQAHPNPAAPQPGAVASGPTGGAS